MTEFTVNGQRMEVGIDGGTPLLWVLREHLKLTGTKFGCGVAACGACTLHVDGRQARSCILPVGAVRGKQVTTIEGLARNGQLHAVQAAFIAHDAFQCGYCTPGQIMSAVACIREGHAGSDAEIAEWMSGNICRCGAYNHILAAIQQVARGGR